jgi:excinuclease ABC subunit A
VYTDLADWARARGHTHLRVDGEFLPTGPASRASTASRSTPSSCRWPASWSTPSDEAALRQALARRCEHGQGRGARAAARWTAWPRRWKRRQPTAGIGALQASSRPSAPARSAARRYAELDPRLFSLQQQARLVPGLRGHGPEAHARAAPACYDDSVRDDDDKGASRALPKPRSKDWPTRPAPALRGRAAQRHRARRDVRRPRHRRRLAALSVQPTYAAWVESLRGAGALSRAARPSIARDLMPEIGSRAATSWRRSGLGYLTLDRGAPDAERRRGAAHPPGRAARQQPAGRVLRARRAHHRPASRATTSILLNALHKP